MKNRPVTIAVAGGSGSGKTTVAEAILKRVGADQIAYLQHDSYYFDWGQMPLDPRPHSVPNFDHPNSLETDLLVKHLKQLQAGHAAQVPIYDFTTYRRRAEARRLDPQLVILVEGLLIFAEKKLRELFDIKIFVDTDSDIRFIRRLRRDIAERGRTLEAVIDQYLGTVRPMHLEFVEPSKRYADVIIPEGGFNTVALDMVVARIQGMLPPA
jgi:uridine kinase